MSYVRWSTPIKDACKHCGRTKLFKNSGESEPEFWIRCHLVWTELNKKNGGLCDKCTSPWYIYHSTDSGVIKKEQILAVWCVGSETLPHLTYDDVKQMIRENDYSEIEGFKEYGDPEGILTTCLKSWIDDMDAEYTEVTQ